MMVAMKKSTLNRFRSSVLLASAAEAEATVFRFATLVSDKAAQMKAFCGGCAAYHAARETFMSYAAPVALGVW